jgi:hypothetical protein
MRFDYRDLEKGSKVFRRGEFPGPFPQKKKTFKSHKRLATKIQRKKKLMNILWL